VGSAMSGASTRAITQVERRAGETKGSRGGRASRFCTQMWKTEMCCFYGTAKGCRKESACPFAQHPSEIIHRPDLTKTSICTRWGKGECNLPAEKCKYAHGEEDRRFTPYYVKLLGKKEDHDSSADASTVESDSDREKRPAAPCQGKGYLPMGRQLSELSDQSTAFGRQLSLESSELSDQPTGFGRQFSLESYQSTTGCSSLSSCKPDIAELCSMTDGCAPAMMACPTRAFGLDGVAASALGPVDRDAMELLLGPRVTLLRYPAGKLEIARLLRQAADAVYED